MSSKRPGELTCAVLGALHRCNEPTSREVASAIEETHDKVGVTLRRLRDAGLAQSRADATKHMKPHVWLLTKTGDDFRLKLIELLGGAH